MKSFLRAFGAIIFFTLLNGMRAWAQEPAACEHDWGFPTWTCADDYSAATAHFTCTLCDETEDVDGTLTDFNLADGHKVYWVNHDGIYNQVFGPNVLQPGLNQTLQTNHPYFIQSPNGPRNGAYRIWTGDARAVKYYMLDDEDVSSINFTISGEAMYYTANSDKSPNDFDGNLDYFHSHGILYGIVFWARDEGESVTVNVKGVMDHTFTVSDAIIGGTVSATPYKTRVSYLIERSKAYEDDIVWLDPAPDEGFEIMSMTVTDVKGRDVPVLEHESRKYFIMPEVAVTISAQYRPTTWTALQTVLSNASTDAENPTVVTLANDIVAGGGESYLELPYGHFVILDLNGNTIDRQLTEGTSNGYVIKVNDGTSLTIRDSEGGGIITGGWNINGPGCITVASNGTLRLESGTISGNRTNMQGGSAISSSGTVYITGGTISDNWSNIELRNNSNTAMCGAFYFSSGGTLYMSGGTITGNRCRTTTYGAAGIGAYLGMGAPNLHLSGNYNISGNMQGDYNEQTGEWSNLIPSDILNTNRVTYYIDAPISPTAPAAMVLYTDGGYRTTFTSGWSTYMDGDDPENYFVLVDNTKAIRVVGGEATIGTLHSITTEGYVTASETEAIAGMTVTLGCNHYLPQGYSVDFRAEAGGDDITASAVSGNVLTMPDEDVTITLPIKEILPFEDLILIVDEADNRTIVIDDYSELDRIVITEDLQTCQVMNNRTFTVGRAATVILPFSYDRLNEQNGGVFYEFDDVVYDDQEGKWVVNMNETENITANTPYLFMPNATHMSFDEPVTIKANVNITYSTTGGTNGEWIFTGSYGKKVWDEPSDDYGFAAVAGKSTDGVTDIEAGQFVRFTGDGVNNAFIKPMRCYLSYVEGQHAPMRGTARRGASDGIPQVLTVRLKGSNGGTTDIGTIDLKSGEIEMDIWYDMNGRMLDSEPTEKGLYIHNGIKVVIE